MGYMFTQGTFLLLGLAIIFILLVVSLFVGHIIIFDSIALGIFAGVCCNHFTTLHPALFLLVGAAVFAALLFLRHTRFGFWIIGVLLSAVWAVIFRLLALTGAATCAVLFLFPSIQVHIMQFSIGDFMDCGFYSLQLTHALFDSTAFALQMVIAVCAAADDKESHLKLLPIIQITNKLSYRGGKVLWLHVEKV